MRTRGLVFVLLAFVTLVVLGSVSCSDDAVPPASAPADGGGVDGGPTRAAFGLDTRPPNATCKAPARPPGQAPVELKHVFQDIVLDDPASGPPLTTGAIMLAQRPGDGARWYLSRRHGQIVTFDAAAENGGPAPDTKPRIVADLAQISGMPVLTEDEQGFHGMAFDPDFATTGHLYVSFTTRTAADGANFATEIGRLTSTDGGESFTGPYTTILHYERTAVPEHHGGSIVFGRDGFLYIATGDGTDESFPQSKDSLLGKVLRIDPKNPAGGEAYGIPADNPFADGAGGLPEIWAWGLRNPYRMTVDRLTGDLWVGDVGAEAWEEIDRVEKGGNYGWPCREGAHDHPIPDPEQAAFNCPNRQGLIDPVYDYAHAPDENGAAGGSVTGGFVYRGSAIPGLQGTYLFNDFITKKAFGLAFDGTTWKATQLNADGAAADGWVSFAEDQAGELYLVSLVDRSIHKVVPKGAAPASTFPERLSQTGCFRADDPTKPADGVLPFTVNAALWSDGAEKERWLAIPDGATIAVDADGDFDLPKGTVLAKSFALGGKRIETRLLVRHDDGDWAGYSYEWNDAQTDATLLPSGKARKVGNQTWRYPERSDCPRCHTAGAGRSLGLEIAQLNGDQIYASTNRISNQLATLDHVGYFAAPIGAPATLPSYPDPFGGAPVDPRARAYLHANCAGCHRPGGGAGRSTMDLRFATPLASTASCGASPIVDDLGVPSAALLQPAKPEQSILGLRLRATDAKRMPPLAKELADPRGVALIEEWIKSLTTCPTP